MPGGGAVLGGTGIAEVTLPKTYHAPREKKIYPDDTYGPGGAPSNLPSMPGYDFKSNTRHHVQHSIGLGEAEDATQHAPTGRRDDNRPGFKPHEKKDRGTKRRNDTGNVKDDQFFRKFMKREGSRY